MAFDVHQAVTDKIIATMEAGEAGQWVCPWHRTGGGLPRNALTGKAYRGINTLSLWVGAQASGYSDDRWATYKQWTELGAQVRKGERSTLVVFFKEMEAEGENDRKRFVARASYAFNASQVDGAPAAASLPAPSDWTLPGELSDSFPTPAPRSPPPGTRPSTSLPRTASSSRSGTGSPPRRATPARPHTSSCTGAGRKGASTGT